MSSLPPDKSRRELRRLRYRAGYTQAQMAEKVGLSRQAYHAIESNGAMPSPRNAQAIAQALGIDPEDFLEELVA